MKSYKEFGITSWAINNKTTIYVLICTVLYAGIYAFNSMPKENFPEINDVKIYVSTAFPGNTAEDIEKLINTPLEKDLKNVKGFKEVTSTATEDFGSIGVKFKEGISNEQALMYVKDIVDQRTAQSDWPTFNGIKVKPKVFQLTLSEEIPVLNIAILGNYPLLKLEQYAKKLKDLITELPEIKDVSIQGIEEKEVAISINPFKMDASKVSFSNIINALQNNNVNLSGGNLINENNRKAIVIGGSISNSKDFLEIVVKNNGQKPVFLKDIATVAFGTKETTSITRNFAKPALILSVKKRSGANLVLAIEAIKTIIKKFQTNHMPSDTEVRLSNDLSSKTIREVNSLINNIFFGVVLVVLVLMFFLGLRNALFVGFAIPMSMLLSMTILNMMGYTVNTMILFALVMGLGMLVDNGIVVVENVYRLMDKENMSRMEAAKKGIGEVAFPIIISTATTIAAFIPLGFWPGIMGQFMRFFPITLSVVLSSSLFVALLFNAVVVSRWMQLASKAKKYKMNIYYLLGACLFGIILYLLGEASKPYGAVLLWAAFVYTSYQFVLKKASQKFQEIVIPRWERFYQKILSKSMNGKKPYFIIGGTVLLLIISFMGFGVSIATQNTKIEFFPDNIPNEIIVYIEYPESTALEKTNNITKDIEKRVLAVVDKAPYTKDGKQLLVSSMMTTVGQGAGNIRRGGNSGTILHKGKVSLSMVAFKDRNGLDTSELRKKIADDLKNRYAGVAISVEKNISGPDAGYPVNIELKGDNYEELLATAQGMKSYLTAQNIGGIEGLKIDINQERPIFKIKIDKLKAGVLGLNMQQIGMQIRNAIFGGKAGDFKKDGENYDIYVRFDKAYRYDLPTILNQKIRFRTPQGKLKVVPISAIATIEKNTGFNKMKHLQGKRIIKLYSNLSAGYTDAGAVVRQIINQMKNYPQEIPADISIDYTGQIKKQQEQMRFLSRAFFIGLGLIFFLLIFQFNSVSKPFIIMTAIFMSLMGVFFGLIITGKPFVIMMTMIGIIALAGVVVNNAVVLLDYAQLLIDDAGGYRQMGLEQLKALIVKTGCARLRPVLLTAITTILGLIPLAIGLNIDFYSLLIDFKPDIYVGGDNVVFWGPLAWTVIFGLFVATFLTLIVVPVMFFMSMRIKRGANYDDRKVKLK